MMALCGPCSSVCFIKDYTRSSVGPNWETRTVVASHLGDPTKQKVFSNFCFYENNQVIIQRFKTHQAISFNGAPLSVKQ